MTSQGPARRRTSKLSELVPVRFPPETLAKIRDAADADDRSVSAWIRRAVDRELEQSSKDGLNAQHRQRYYERAIPSDRVARNAGDAARRVVNGAGITE
jgi:hypothetical protein